MSIHVLAPLLRREDLRPNEKLLLLQMADKCSDDGSNAFQAIGTLADRTGFDRRTVQRLIRRLSDPARPGGPLLEQTSPARGGRPATYTIHYARGLALTAVPEGRQPAAPATTSRGGTVPPTPPEGRHHAAPGAAFTTPSMGGTVPPNTETLDKRELSESSENRTPPDIALGFIAEIRQSLRKEAAG